MVRRKERVRDGKGLMGRMKGEEWGRMMREVVLKKR